MDNFYQWFRRFKPTDITCCNLWLDATDPTSYVVSGSNVATWYDKSGAGQHFTASTGPVVSSSVPGFNGKNVMSFNGTTQALASISPITWSYSTTSASMFVVLQPNNTVTTTKIIVELSPSISGKPGTFYWDIHESVDNQLQTLAIGGNIGVSGKAFTSFTSSQTSRLGITYDFNIASGSGINIYSNNVNTGSLTNTAGTATTLATGQKLFLGARNQTSSFYPGYISEVVMYNKVLSDDERAILDLYFQTKYENNPSPMAISNLRLWLDANDASTISTSGSNVVQWADKSGNGYLIGQGATGSRPTYDTTSSFFGGKPSVYFGANSWLTSSAAIQLSGSRNTIVFLVRIQAIPSTMALMESATAVASGNPGTFLIDTAGGPLNQIRLNPTPSNGIVAITQYSGTNPVPIISTPYVFASVFSPDITNSQPTLYLNGSNVGVTATSGSNVTNAAMSNTAVVIGARSNGSLLLNGSIAECLIYNKDLSQAEISYLQYYFKNKWGF